MINPSFASVIGFGFLHQAFDANEFRPFPVIARSEATKQSRIQCSTLDCFATLAMTGKGR
jgi:hypothetical protein